MSGSPKIKPNTRLQTRLRDAKSGNGNLISPEWQEAEEMFGSESSVSADKEEAPLLEDRQGETQHQSINNLKQSEKIERLEDGMQNLTQSMMAMEMMMKQLILNSQGNKNINSDLQLTELLTEIPMVKESNLDSSQTSLKQESSRPLESMNPDRLKQESTIGHYQSEHFPIQKPSTNQISKIKHIFTKIPEDLISSTSQKTHCQFKYSSFLQKL